jgi:hypothetical protein
VDQDAVLVASVEGVAGDVVAAVDHQDAQAARGGDALGHDGAGETGAHDQDVRSGHMGCVGG